MQAETATVLGGALLCLVISYVFGHRRIFWEDEMLGWMLLRDPSWHHMVQAWKMGADGGGFSFYLSGRLWLLLFGASEIAFRLYSAVCFAAAFVVTWMTGRHFYRRGVVAFALVNTWFFSPPIVTHMAEGRFYGLLMLGTALTLWWTIVLSQRQRRVPLWMYLSCFAFHGLLVTSHTLGVIYSAAMLLSLIAVDWYRGWSRPLIYVTASLTWLLLIPEREAIRASANVGRPHFWTLPPNLSRFLGSFTAYSAEVAATVLLLIAALLWNVYRGRRDWRVLLEAALEERRPVYVATALLFGIPVAIAAKSFTGTSLFINRYLMPVALAVFLLTAEILTLMDWEIPVFRGVRGFAGRHRGLLTWGYAALLSFWIFGHVSRVAIGQKNYTDELTRKLPKHIPVVCEDAWTFTELIGRQHASGVRYTYLLDWRQSISPSAPRLEVTQYHLMENWKKAGYFSGSIEDSRTFLKQQPHFFVLHFGEVARDEHGPVIGNPWYERLRDSGSYTVTMYVKGDKEHLSVWEVRRKGGGSTGSL